MASIKTGLTYQDALLGQRKRVEHKEAFKMADLIFHLQKLQILAEQLLY